jgi:RNA polymerase sigma factor (TIGR02999 family)
VAPDSPPSHFSQTRTTLKSGHAWSDAAELARASDQHRSATINQLLESVQAGNRAALNELYAVLYDELRVLARRQRRRWENVGTLNTTALVHEAYLKLMKQRRLMPTTRAHFFALAATAMRHIVSNYARDRQAKKRGRDVLTVSLDTIESGVIGALRVSDEHADLLVAIDEALDRLERISPRQRSVVECRFFGGLSIDETAAAIGIAERTVKRDWALAQAWLYREMKLRA